MGRQKKKHKYHLVKNENTGFNGMYEDMKKSRAINIHDYVFLCECCELSKNDHKLLRSKILDINSDVTDNNKNYLDWYKNFVKVSSRLPLIKDYLIFKK